MRYCSRSGFIGWLALMPAIGLCGSWDITQDINLSSNLMLLQENASNSTQAGNYINLNDSISDASQTVTLDSDSVSLTQDHATASKQALNYLSSPSISNSQQTISGVTNFSLTQIYGSGNLQAGNLIEGNTQVGGSHNQSIQAGTVTFSQTNGNLIQTPNIQAGNAAIGTTSTVNQSFSTDTITVTSPSALPIGPSGNNYNIKAANYIDITN